MQHYYVVESIFVLLALALLVAVIRWPKDALIKLPLGLLSTLFRPFRSILYIPLSILAFGLLFFAERFRWPINRHLEAFLDLDVNAEEDKPYPAKSNLVVNFAEGDKYVYVIYSDKDLKIVIGDFLELLTQQHSISDFVITRKGDLAIVAFPKSIGFYDFHLMVQHLHGELGEQHSFGVYKSATLEYYVFQDPATLNNLVGYTSDKQFFSIYLLDDLEAKQYLKINKKLPLDIEWVERWV